MTRLINSRKKKINKKISRNKRNYIGSGNMETYLDKFLNSDDNFLNESEKYVKRFITQVMSNRQEMVNCIAKYSKDCRNFNLAVKRLYTNPILKKNIKNVFKILSESYNEDITLNDILYNVGESAKIYADSDSDSVNVDLFFAKLHFKAKEGLDEELIDHNQVVGLFIFLAFTDMYYISIAMENNLILNGGAEGSALAVRGSTDLLLSQQGLTHKFNNVPERDYTKLEKAVVATTSLAATVAAGAATFALCGPACAVGGVVGGGLMSLAGIDYYNKERHQTLLEHMAKDILEGTICPPNMEPELDELIGMQMCKEYVKDKEGIPVVVKECLVKSVGHNDEPNSCSGMFTRCVLEGSKEGIKIGEKCLLPSKVAPGSKDIVPKSQQGNFGMSLKDLGKMFDELGAPWQ